MYIILLRLTPAFERSREFILRTVTNRNHAYWHHFSRDAQNFAQDRIVAWINDASEGSSQAFIHYTQQQDHNGAANVHVPERYRPGNLVAFLVDFIGLVVTSVISGLTGARNDQDWRLGDKRVKTALDIRFFFAEASDLQLEFGLGDDHERLPLRKASAGRMSSQFQDPLDDLKVHRFR